MTRGLLMLLFICSTCAAFAGNKIKYYFTQPVNNSVSRGENAVYVNDKMGDTIVAYINRSKYTLDIAVYNYTSTAPGIAVAINAAFNRGVVVRWIYDSSSSNTGIPLLNGAIGRLASPPDAGSYSIMHNKFMVIDANSTDPADAFVWTGSSNWNSQQFNTDYNNAVVIQDQAIAKAFRGHFNMMWGGTGAMPDKTLSKFGQFKTDLGSHNFYVEGKLIEVYFSPADNTNDKILNAMNSANTDMYFGISTFTHSSDANMLLTKDVEGVYVAGINDAGNVAYTPHTILSSGLGSAKYKLFSGTGLYHNKTLIVDPSNTCSDPLVVTGSHNWTVSADTKNDENTVIIHDATTANVYYQSFYADFTSQGGSLPSIPHCNAGVGSSALQSDELIVYPNPSHGSFTVAAPELMNGMQVQVCSITGMVVYSSPSHIAGRTLTISIAVPGVYMLRCITPKGVIMKQIAVQ